MRKRERGEAKGNKKREWGWGEKERGESLGKQEGGMGMG